jgi:hypothetical protein
MKSTTAWLVEPSSMPCGESPCNLPDRSFMNNEIPAATNINVSLLSYN